MSKSFPSLESSSEKAPYANSSPIFAQVTSDDWSRLQGEWRDDPLAYYSLRRTYMTSWWEHVSTVIRRWSSLVYRVLRKHIVTSWSWAVRTIQKLVDGTPPPTFVTGLSVARSTSCAALARDMRENQWVHLRYQQEEKMRMYVSPQAREEYFESLAKRETNIRTTKGAKYADASSNEYNTVAHFNKLSQAVGSSPAQVAWFLCQKSLDGYKYHLLQLARLLEAGPRPNFASLLVDEMNQLTEYANDVRNYIGFGSMLSSAVVEHVLTEIAEAQQKAEAAASPVEPAPVEETPV